ncbi:MAG: cupin domain-containing protein [Elusimicrobiales bacterium]
MEVEIKKLSPKEIEELKIKTWPIWTKEKSEFDWYYDSKEMCYFLEGEVVVETENKNYEIKKGDFVVFPKGLKCKWIVKQNVKKHYKFE